MNYQDVIRDAEEQAAEWLEMSQDPANFVAGFLAQKIVTLKSHIEYLEKRIHAYEHATTSRHISNIR